MPKISPDTQFPAKQSPNDQSFSIVKSYIHQSTVTQGQAVYLYISFFLKLSTLLSKCSAGASQVTKMSRGFVTGKDGLEYWLLNVFKSIPPADHNKLIGKILLEPLFLEINVQNFTLKYLKKRESYRTASDEHYYLQN